MIYYINDVTIDNEEVLVEYGAAGTATGTYEYGLQRLSVEYVNEAKEYYLYNGTGNVTQTTAENGSMFLRYTYDPFGNVTSINAPMTVDIDDLNRYTYNGEDYDYNTGLQYLRARYYSTSAGSFISQDTYLGDLLNPLSQNRYTYCHNSPVMFDDPSGHSIRSGGMYSNFRHMPLIMSSIPQNINFLTSKTNGYISTVCDKANSKSSASNCEQYDEDNTQIKPSDIYREIRDLWSAAILERPVGISDPIGYNNFRAIESLWLMYPVRSVGVTYSATTVEDGRPGYMSSSYAIVYDKYGNINISKTESHGVGIPDISGSVFYSFSTANRLEQVGGNGTAIGGAIPDGVSPMSFGTEYSISEDGSIYNIAVSIGVGISPISFYGTESYTELMFEQYNIVDEICNVLSASLESLCGINSTGQHGGE